MWFLLPASLLFFALGYALYAFGFVAAGAIVAHQEDVAFATTPLTPSLMPARIAVGTGTWWEVVLAPLLMMVAIYGMVQLATRIYKATLVRSGPWLSWREALRVRLE